MSAESAAARTVDPRGAAPAARRAAPVPAAHPGRHRPHLPPLALALVEDERRCTSAGGTTRRPSGASAFVTHKAPLWWVVFLTLTLLIPLIAGTDKILTIASTFAIYASINLMWMLIMGTAGIFSLASLAVTGVAAYTACWLTHQPRPALAADVPGRRRRRPAASA